MQSSATPFGFCNTLLSFTARVSIGTEKNFDQLLEELTSQLVLKLEEKSVLLVDGKLIAKSWILKDIQE